MAEKIRHLDNGDMIIEDLDRRSTVFFYHDIYQAIIDKTEGDIRKPGGKYLPNVEDLVIDYEMGTFRVTRVDRTRALCWMTPWNLTKTPTNTSDDPIIGEGFGQTNRGWRLLIDTRVTPHRAEIDNRYKKYGSQNNFIRVFRGIDITKTGKVVSAMYDQSNSYTGENIPLELVAVKELHNLAVKAPVPFFVNEGMTNGERCTVVTYTKDGVVSEVDAVYVQHTNLIRSPEDQAQKIQSIELVSPYLSKSEPNVLRVPVNATVHQLTMRCRVTYISGRTKTVDITDESGLGKAHLLGLKYWSPNITGTRHELTLVYHPDPNTEYAHTQGVTANGAIVMKYQIEAIPTDPSYSLKVYAFPTWVDASVGYGIDFWLYDLNRINPIRIPQVAIEYTNNRMFDGKDYSSIQHLNLSVNLGLLDGKFDGKRHVQSLHVALLREGTVDKDRWKVKASTNQKEWFGEGVSAKIISIGTGIWHLDLSNDLKDINEWLDEVYYKLDPMYDSETENRAPHPTHFRIKTRDKTFEVPVSQWAAPLSFHNDMKEGETIYLQWYSRSGGKTLELGVTGMTVKLS